MLEIESGLAPKLRDFDKACTVLYSAVSEKKTLHSVKDRILRDSLLLTLTSE